MRTGGVSTSWSSEMCVISTFRIRYLFQENIMEHLTHQKEEKYAELIFNFYSGQTYYPQTPWWSIIQTQCAPTGARRTKLVAMFHFVRRVNQP